MKPSKLMQVPVTEFLTGVQAFSSSDPVSKAIGYLQESRSKEAIVDEGDARSWVVPVRDLLKVSALDTKLSTVMSQVPRLGPNNTIGDAATLMREFRTRSMPVYKERRLLGQVTAPSIVDKLLDSDTPGRVSSIMTPHPVCGDVDDSVAKAREKMLKNRFDQLPVQRAGSLYGVVTVEDIVFNLMPKAYRVFKGNPGPGRLDDKLSSVADREPTTNDVADSLRAVHQNMAKGGSNYSVITGTGELQGIVTFRDFLTVLAKKAVSDSIPMYIVGLPEDPFEAETARTKFQGAVELLHRSIPDISEARATIKMGETKAPKKKYEVKVFLVHPREHYSYSVRSYELADAFDEVNNWVKELVQRGKTRPKGRKDGSNARAFPDDFRPETAPG